MSPHNLYFMLGTVYYLVCPVLIGYYEFFIDMPGVKFWWEEFNSSRNSVAYYFIVVFLYFVFFYIGSSFFYLLPKLKGVKVNVRQTTKVPKLVYIGLLMYAFIILIIVFTFIVRYRAYLFTGYTTYDIELLGQLGTLNMLSSFFLVFIIIHNEKKYKIVPYILVVYVLTVALSTLILLGLGSRMYVIIPITMYITYKLFFSDNKIKVYSILVLIAFSLLASVFIAAWRIQFELSPESIIYFFFVEPLFTWWSTATFLKYNNIILIEFPDNFLTSFLNFLPSFLFKEKADLIYPLREKYFYEAPLGADSIFVNIQGNFGVLLGIVYTFFLGFYFSYVYNISKRSFFFKAYYISIASIIPFQLFRDNFAIINKQLFWNTLILPGLMIGVLFLVNYLALRGLRK